jgi:hypothetical protein
MERDRRKKEIGEERHLVKVSSRQLVEDNLATGIVNKESYSSMDAKFSVRQFDNPQVVAVLSGVDKWKYLIVDGMTRTLFAAENSDPESVSRLGIDLSTITVNDITDDVIENPRYMKNGKPQIVGGKKVITMTQYLRAVIPPTKVHQQIAPSRMAAHWINAWEMVVGKNLAKKFSAIAAFEVIYSADFGMGRLENFIARQDRFIENESPRERKAIEMAILELSEGLRESGLNKSMVRKSAIDLIATRSGSVGPEEKIKEQLVGMLSGAELERKLADIVPGDAGQAERARLRSELGDLLWRNINEQDPSVAIRDLSTFMRAIVDTRLTWENLLRIVESANPDRAYERIIDDKDREALIRDYLKKTGGRDRVLTDTEVKLLSVIGDGNAYARVSAVQKAVLVINEASKIYDQLESKELLREGGVSEEVIKQARAWIGTTLDDLLTDERISIAGLGAARNNLEAGLEKIKAKIRFQLRDRQYKDIINAELGQRSQTGLPGVALEKIASYLHEKDFEELEDARLHLRELSGLSNQLMDDVLLGRKTLAHAKSAHRAQMLEKQIKITTPPPSATESSSPSRAENIYQRAASRSTIVSPRNVMPSEEKRLEKKSVNIALENSKLKRVIADASASARDILSSPLEFSQLEKQNQNELLDLFDKLGSYIVGMSSSHEVLLRVKEEILKREEERAKTLDAQEVARSRQVRD